VGLLGQRVRRPGRAFAGFVMRFKPLLGRCATRESVRVAEFGPCRIDSNPIGEALDLSVPRDEHGEHRLDVARELVHDLLELPGAQ
jgi:hypothetical protein